MLTDIRNWTLIYDNGYRYLVSIVGNHYERLELVSSLSESDKFIVRDINTGKYYEYDKKSGNLKESSVL